MRAFVKIVKGVDAKLNLNRKPISLRSGQDVKVTFNDGYQVASRLRHMIWDPATGGVAASNDKTLCPTKKRSNPGEFVDVPIRSR
jgi:hypothetical protein